MKLRQKIRPLTSCKNGDGSIIFFWYDNWSSEGPLTTFFVSGEQTFPAIPSYAMVSSIYTRGSWQWPQSYQANIRNIIDCIQSSVRYATQDTQLFKDHITVKVSFVWETIHPRRSKVQWHKLLWFLGHIVVLPSCAD